MVPDEVPVSDIEGPDSSIDDAVKLISSKAEVPPKAEVRTPTPRTPPVQDDPYEDEPEDNTPVEDEPVDQADEEIDVDDIEIPVVVDGQQLNVSIRDLKKNYSFEGAVEKRLAEATNGRNRMVQQANALHQALGHTAQRLQALDNILAEAEAPDIDLDELRIKDPTRYLFEKERIREIAEKRQQLSYEQHRIAQQQQELQNDALMRHSASEAQVLGQILPEFADPDKAPQAMQSLAEGASRFYKYSPAEVFGVSDHRALVVLNDALQWRRLQAKNAKAKGEAQITPKQLVKPSVSTRGKLPGTSEAKKMEALRAAARKSGTVNDVAATLLVRRGPRR